MKITRQNKNSTAVKISDIESTVHNLYENKLPVILSRINGEKAENISLQLKNLKFQIKNLSKGSSLINPAEFGKLIDIEQSIKNIKEYAEKIESNLAGTVLPEIPGYNKLHLQLVNSFFNSAGNGNGTEAKKTVPEGPVEKISGYENGRTCYAGKIITELEQCLDKLYTLADENGGSIIKITVNKSGGENKAAEKERNTVTIIKEHDPIIIHSTKKTEGIFNDANLTEDYELGFRFHQLNLKMGFFNVNIDSSSESTRIATAEFFPNTFWASVKQRSRWIAGICLQNWKAHKWNGNFVTKYFLFRDRKPLLSIFGTFFSNIILVYYVYNIINEYFNPGSGVTIAEEGSSLSYLIYVVLFFMFSRMFHRFVYTYNWYGFKYAFFSLFRIIVDAFVNFFAVLRAFKVFKQTKKKVVWDSTAHY